VQACDFSATTVGAAVDVTEVEVTDGMNLCFESTSYNMLHVSKHCCLISLSLRRCVESVDSVEKTCVTTCVGCFCYFFICGVPLILSEANILLTGWLLRNSSVDGCEVWLGLRHVRVLSLTVWMHSIQFVFTQNVSLC